MKNTLLGWLAAKGITLANDATDQAVLSAVQKAFTDATSASVTLANEKETSDGKITALENEKTALTGKVTTLENENTSLKTSNVELKKARASAIVDLAITQGRLKPADREAKITTLANAADEPAFVKETEGLLKSAKIVKTNGGDDAKSGKILANDMSDSGCRQTYLDALNKHMSDHPDDSGVEAHAKVMAAHPTLAAAMKSKNVTVANAADK